MDRPHAAPDFVPSKTARGLMAVSGRPGVVPRELLVVLAAVDGRSSVDEIAARPDVRMSRDEVEDALARLVDDGFVRRLPPPDGDLERERLMEAVAKVGADDLEVEDELAAAEPSGPELESLLAEFNAFVNGAPVPKTLPRLRARRLLRFAAERFAEQHRALVATDGAREQALQQYAVLRQEIDRARAASGDAQSMPDNRRLFEAVLAREQQGRVALRDAQTRIAELEGRIAEITAGAAERHAAVEARHAETLEVLATTRTELQALRAAGDSPEMRERLAVADARVAALETELAEARAHVERSDAALAAAEARWRDREAELERQAQQLANEAEELVKNTWERGQDDLLRERRERNAEVKRLVEAIQGHAAREENLVSERDQQRARVVAVEGERDAARAEATRLRTELETSEQTLDRVRREHVAAFTEREELLAREREAKRVADEARADASRAAAALAAVLPLREALAAIERDGAAVTSSLRRAEEAVSNWRMRAGSVLAESEAAAAPAPAAPEAASEAVVVMPVPPAVSPAPDLPTGVATEGGRTAGMIDTRETPSGDSAFPTIRHEGMVAG